MAMQVEGWAYAMSQKGRTFNLHGHVFQWTGVRMQKVKVTRKVLEFSVRPRAVFSTLMADTRPEIESHCLASGTTAER